MLAGLVPLPGGVQGDGEVAAQARLGAGERAVHSGECGGEVGDGGGVAELDEAVAAPAGQVGIVQREVGQLFGGGLAELAGGQVERGMTVGVQVDGGGHLGFGGVEPAAELAGDTGGGLVTDGADLLQGLGGLAEVQQDIGLLPGSERQEGVVPGFAGGGGGGLEVVPCGGGLGGVDGLPSSQGGSVGQDQGEPLAAPGGKGVVEAVLELADVGGQLGGDGGGAEPAVELADVLRLVLEELGNGVVDVAGAGSNDPGTCRVVRDCARWSSIPDL